MSPRRGLGLALATICGATPLRAQQDICRPSASSNEAKTFAILSVPIAFSGGHAPERAHGISVALEFATLPTVDSITAKPTACRPDKNAENTHPIAGLVRPRVAVAIRGFVLEASWVPPVPVNHVTANLVGLAIARPVRLPGNWYAGVRAFAVLGTLHGPITCDDRAIGDPASECYRGTRSDDRWRPGVFGAEAVVGGGPRNFRPYLGVGYTLLRPRFQVNFTNALGSTDRRQVIVDLQRVAAFGGLTWRIGKSRVTLEAYSTPGDAVAGRLVVSSNLQR